MYGYIGSCFGDHLDPGEQCECRDEGKRRKVIREEPHRHCDICGCELYPDNRLATMDGRVICKDCLNDEMGGDYDI